MSELSGNTGGPTGVPVQNVADKTVDESIVDTVGDVLEKEGVHMENDGINLNFESENYVLDDAENSSVTLHMQATETMVLGMTSLPPKAISITELPSLKDDAILVYTNTFPGEPNGLLLPKVSHSVLQEQGIQEICY